jgi:Fur family transcriptional regulator, ferric uptake regulator
MKTQTRQRAAIRDVLQKERRPMTAEEIYRLARQTIPAIGLSTVYRSIRRMVGEQQLVGVDFPGHPPRYELPTRDVHSHFICSACEKVFDLPEAPEISPVALPAGFTSHGYEVIVFGICQACGEKEAKR